MKKQFRGQADRIVEKSGLGYPFPKDLNFLGVPPVMFIDRYEIHYIHSLGQDSPFFMGIKNRRLLSTWCKLCEYRYGTPRGHCMYCGEECEWFELPKTGKIHALTVCHLGSEAFLDQTPYALILVGFEGVDTLFLSRLEGADMENPTLDWIGMPVKVKFSKGLSGKKAPLVSNVYFVPV